MDYYENGSLHDYFIRKNNKPPSANMIKSIMTQVLDALMYMKQNFNMVHRDIKPGNILVRRIENDSIDICLADFGMAKNTPGLSENSSLSRAKGTEGFIAPEIYRPISEQRYSLASDIFALGATLFKLMTRISLNEFPYFQWSLDEPTKRNHSSKLEEMIYKMLKINTSTPHELIQNISKMFITDTKLDFNCEIL
ncbi:predicted protein [Naegleria gruberi]|uniref:Predicted protein n=1 Tax=Naegleria gruberi TaxID=5762 RepID=D2VVP8_NAEGR|nr:uncharacterized protein NAEGRDRAFT_73097 [Naegleria gruberi]EFC39079.1 predicted protein [Naegleria gruberi]|eukprot:XP_002671823.1 predicted protein [Naegleria gruberi strain NEG-M]